MKFLKLLFTVSPKIIKYIGINLTKEHQDIYTKNHKTLLKKVKEDLNKWKDIVYSWIERLIIFKMTISLWWTIFHMIPIKTLLGFIAIVSVIVETDKLIITFIWWCKGSRIIKGIKKRKSKVGELALLDFNTYYKASKIVWYWWKKQAYRLCQLFFVVLFFNKVPIQKGKSFQQIMLGQLNICLEKLSIYPYFTPHPKINSK